MATREWRKMCTQQIKFIPDLNQPIRMLDWMVAFDRMMMVKQVRIVYFTFSKPIYQPFDSV